MKDIMFIDKNIYYTPDKGIYRYDEATDSLQLLSGQIDPLNTNSAFEAPINSDVLKALGFNKQDGNFINGSLVIDFDLLTLSYNVGGKLLANFSDLEEECRKHGINIPYDQLLDAFSKTVI